MGLFGISKKELELFQKMEENLEKSEQNISTLTTLVEIIAKNNGTSLPSANNISELKNFIESSTTLSVELVDKIEKMNDVQIESAEQRKQASTEIVDVLKLTQENLGISQKSTENLAAAVNQLTESKKQEENKKPAEIDKLKAAYALNLCTVSVSQIIDYNDIYFLEQEYDAILNNLNLEQMPKDQALLDILKQLLDVITYFRIQEGDRKMMEKDYQQKMKDAIWNAVPNFGLVVASSDPIAMAVSLASQVGIGYMNYRKSKAENEREREKQEWELQRSAMEQFHGLRRELFDTAWRLAEKYEFDDNLRLTERQITQYNEILMDNDALRRYERLDYIKNNFEAYPPFWYYFGHAANDIYQDTEGKYTDIEKEIYKNHAKEHFNDFINKTGKGLLREDHLLAAGALELFDLLLLETPKESNPENVKRQIKLLETAKKASGNAYDIMNLCAMAYLEIGNQTIEKICDGKKETITCRNEACDILKMLINAGYNTIANAQILSQLYVGEYIENKNNEEEKKKIEEKYNILCALVDDPDYLYPLSHEKNEFIEVQKNALLSKYAAAMKEFIEKYQSQYNTAFKGCTATMLIEILNNMYNSLCDFPCSPNIYTFYNEIQKSITNNKSKFIDYNKGTEDVNATTYTDIKFKGITKNAFEKLAECLHSNISSYEKIEDISKAEKELRDFCRKNELYEIVAIIDNSKNKNAQVPGIKSVFSLYSITEQNNNADMRNNMLEVLKEYSDKDNIQKLINHKNEKTRTKIIKTSQFLISEPYTIEFDTYKRNTYDSIGINKANEIIAVFQPKFMGAPEYVFTTTGITMLKNNGKGIINHSIPYSLIAFEDNKMNKKYNLKNINYIEFENIISKLTKIINSSNRNPIINKNKSLSDKIYDLISLGDDKCENMADQH